MHERIRRSLGVVNKISCQGSPPAAPAAAGANFLWRAGREPQELNPGASCNLVSCSIRQGLQRNERLKLRDLSIEVAARAWGLSWRPSRERGCGRFVAAVPGFQWLFHNKQVHDHEGEGLFSFLARTLSSCP